VHRLQREGRRRHQLSHSLSSGPESRVPRPRRPANRPGGSVSVSAAEACAKVAATAGTGGERDRQQLRQLMELRDRGRIAAEPHWGRAAPAPPRRLPRARPYLPSVKFRLSRSTARRRPTSGSGTSARRPGTTGHGLKEAGERARAAGRATGRRSGSAERRTAAAPSCTTIRPHHPPYTRSKVNRSARRAMSSTVRSSSGMRFG
jgi:hypothetical protein